MPRRDSTEHASAVKKAKKRPAEEERRPTPGGAVLEEEEDESVEMVDAQSAGASRAGATGAADIHCRRPPRMHAYILARRALDGHFS